MRICAAVSVVSQYVVARFARRHLKGICAAVSVGVVVRGGSRVMALILLVFVHHYNRARQLDNCVQREVNVNWSMMTCQGSTRSGLP